MAQRLMTTEERIVGVAVMRGFDMYALPRPKRHSDVIAHIVNTLKQPPLRGDELQGFVTNTGRFIDRTEAKRLALRNGQLAHDTPHAELQVEDLW